VSIETFNEQNAILVELSGFKKSRT